MKKFLALLLSLVMLLSLAACGGNNTGGTTGENTGSGNTSGSNTGDSTDTGDTAGTGEIQPTLTIGIASDINELDPQAQNDQINNNCLALTHQTLVFLANENNDYLPCLAESWEWTDDTHLVFHLVQNANFSDGTPFNADDVVFTYEKAMDPDRSAVAATLSLVESVEKIDDYTVQFVTSSYSNELLAVLAGYPLVILSKEAYEDPSNEKPYLIGTGRYVFNEWKQSEYVSFVKNENFWGEDPGVAEEIIFRPILESASRVAALQSGEIDVCIDPPINDLQFLEEDENVVVHNQAGTRLFYFGFNCEHEPFDNQTLRQAISCAIDKQTIVDVVLQGYGQTQKTVVNRGVWSFYDDMEGYEYDVERAKELMAEAGYPDGLDEPVTLYAANSSPYSTIAPMIQQYLSVIGIQVEIVTRDEATLKADCQAGEHDLFLWRWNVIDRLDEIYTELFSTDYATNYHQYSDPWVDEMCVKILTEKDRDTREQLSIEMQEYLVEACPQVPLYVADLVIAYREGLTGQYLFGGGNHNWSWAYVQN